MSTIRGETMAMPRNRAMKEGHVQGSESGIMKRRDLLFNLGAFGITVPHLSLQNLLSLGIIESGSTVGAVASAHPTPQQQVWQDLEFGMFVHFAPNTWQDVESDDLSTPLSAINPAKLDADQWVDTALALGARYIVFVAKHQGGFCMWQTHTTEYSIRNTPWRDGKGDVLAEVAGSCRKRNVPLGVYVCPRDDHFGAGNGGICKTQELQNQYNAMYRQQLTEVFSRYGELIEIWFDGSTVTPVGDLIHRYQPNAMVFQGPAATIRWVGNEDGFAPYPCWNGVEREDARTGIATSLQGDPDGSVWLPNEVDVSIRRPDWFWSTTNANKVLTIDQLLSIYYRSIGRGAQLLLNIPANRDGLLSHPDCEVAVAFGKELQRRFSSPLASTHGTDSSLVLTFDHPLRIDTVVLQEQISQGERIRDYRIEGWVGGSWRLLAEGSAVGHKRIQPVPSQIISAARLLVTKSVGEPTIRTFSVYDTGVAPPADWNAATTVWSSSLVGTWSGENFSLDLTQHISVAGQYILRFRSQEGAVTGFGEVILEIGGISTPGMVRTSRVRRDELLLNITGLDRSIRVRRRVRGANAGSVLLRRQ